MHWLTLLSCTSNGNSPYSMVLKAFHSHAPQLYMLLLGTSDNTMVLKIECVLHIRTAVIQVLNYFNRPSFIACVPPLSHTTLCPSIHQWPPLFRKSKTRAGVLHKIQTQPRNLTGRQKPLNCIA